MANLEDAESIQERSEGQRCRLRCNELLGEEIKVRRGSAGQTIANPAKHVVVKHLIWSALPNVTKMTYGELTGVEHFDSKAEVADYIESMKGDMVATYFMPGFYVQNIKGMIRRGENGIPTFTQPWSASEAHVPLLDSAVDSGTFVAGILAQEPQSINGLFVDAVSQWRTPNVIVDTLSKVYGTKVES